MVTCFYNKKGGVGKTTLSSNIAAVLAYKGYKTLIIDMDAQCNSTRYVFPEFDAERHLSITDLLFDGKNPEDAIFETKIPNLFILPASSKLDNASSRLNQDPLSSPSTKLYTIIKRGKLKERFDFIIIDCPSQNDTVTANALNAADKCVIPACADEFSLVAIIDAIGMISVVSENGIGTEIETDGVIINNFRKNTRVANANYKECADSIPDKLFETIVPQCSEIPDSLPFGPVISLKGNTKSKKIYTDLTNEFLRRNGYALTKGE